MHCGDYGAALVSCDAIDNSSGSVIQKLTSSPAQSEKVRFSLKEKRTFSHAQYPN